LSKPEDADFLPFSQGSLPKPKAHPSIRLSFVAYGAYLAPAPVTSGFLTTLNVRKRSSPCENSNACRARRSILEKLRIMRTDAAADIRLDAVLENCILYISPMYVFSHSLGQSLPSHSAPVPANVCFAPKATNQGMRPN